MKNFQRTVKRFWASAAIGSAAGTAISLLTFSTAGPMKSAALLLLAWVMSVGAAHLLFGDRK